MSTLDTIRLHIDEKAYSYAKIYASLLKDEYQRKRAFASIVALYAFKNFLEESPCDIQNSMTLYRNPILNEQYELTDIYVNNWHLDIRVVTEGDAVLVPNIHYEEGITPDFYVVIKVDKNLKNAEFVGVADTKDEKDEPYDVKYRSIPFSSFINYEEFLNRINTVKKESLSDDDVAFFNENYLGIMDNDIKEDTKNRLLKLLFNNSELRTEFCCFTGFEMVSCNSSKYDDLFNDNMLGIIGANDVDSPKYEGKEEQIYIGNDAEDNTLTDEDNTQNQDNDSEEKEETVSDILDELFGEGDETITPDTVTEKPVDTIIAQTDSIEEYKNDDVLSDDILEDDGDLNPLSDNELDIISDDNPDSEIQELSDDDVSYIEDLDSSIRPMGAVDYDDSITDGNNEETQKVIVDYDENGEPIYSYITNIDKNDSDLFADVDAEVEEENILEQPDGLIEEISEFDDNEKIEEIKEIGETEDTTDSEIIEEEDLKDIIADSETVEQNEIEEIEDEKPAEAEHVDNSEIEEFDEETPVGSENSEYEYFGDEEVKKANLTEDLNENINEENSTFADVDETEENMHEKTDETAEFDSEEENLDGQEYGEGGEYEDDELAMPEEPEKKSSSKLVAGIVGAVVALGLIGGGTALYLNHAKDSNKVETAQNTQQENMFDQPADNEGFNIPEGDGQEFFGGEEGGIPEDQMGGENQNQQEEQTPPEDNGGPQPLTENDLINQNNNPEGDVNKAMVNTFSQGAPSNVSLRELNWFCATELFTDKAFKGYLQNLDNILKQNLRNNFMNATENPQNNTVEAKFAVRKNGDLAKVIISNSSGSNEIDDLVLRSIKESFEGEKSQLLDNTALNSDMYYLKVVIKL